MAANTKVYRVKFETEGFKGVADAFDKLNERMSRDLTVKLKTDGFAAVVSDFESINKKLSETLESYRQINKTRIYLRDDRGRFAASSDSRRSYRKDEQGRFASQNISQGRVLAAETAARKEQEQLSQIRQQFIRRMGFSYDNSANVEKGDFKGRARAKGQFYLSESSSPSDGKRPMAESAQVQGRTIGEYAAKAIREGEEITFRSAVKDGISFAFSSVLSGAFERIGEGLIGDPIVNAIRKGFQENRKQVNPVGVSGGIGFAASSIAFGGFQQIGSKISEVITEDFIRGVSAGFKKRSKTKGPDVESLGESVGEFAADPLGVTKDTIRERKIAKLDESLATAEELSKGEEVAVKPGKVKVFTVGGLGGSGIADFNENLERIGINPDTADIENTENPHTGTNIPLSDPLRFASDAILNKYLRNEVIKGQNQDAINLAAKVIAAKRNNPDAKINLVGHSAGADIVQQAIAILEKGGYADNVQGIGVGGINIGTGFDVKNFTNIAGDNDYVVKATKYVGSKPTTQDFGQVSQLGDHKLRTYFAHPDFIKSLDKDLQPGAVAKILENFYEDMIQAYGEDALPQLEAALHDGQKFADEFDQSFGTEETDRINKILEKYNQRRTEISGSSVSRGGIKSREGTPPPKARQETDPEFTKAQAEARAMFMAFEAFRAEVSQRAQDMAGQASDPSEALNVAAREASQMFEAFETLRSELQQRIQPSQGEVPRIDPDAVRSHIDRQFEEAASLHAGAIARERELKQSRNVTPTPQDIPISIEPDSPRPTNIPIDIGESDLEREQRLLNLRKLKAEARQKYEKAAELHRQAEESARNLKQSRNVTPTPQDIPISVAPDSPRPTNIPIDVGESDLDRERRKETLLNIRRLRAEARQQFKRVAEMQRRAQENAKRLEPSQLAAQQASTPQTFADEAELPQLIEAYQMTLANAVKESGKAMLDSLQSTMEMLAQSAVDGGEDIASEFVLQVNQSFYTYADKVKKSYIKALAAMRGVSANAGKGVGRGNFKQTLEQLRTDFDAILGELQTEMVVQVRDIVSSMDLLLENYEQNYAPPMLAGATNRPDVERFDQLVQDQVMAFQESLEKLLIEIVRARTGSITDLQGDRARVGLPAQAAPQPPQPKAPIGQRYQEYLTGKLQSAKQSAAERVRAIFPVFKQMNLERRDEALKAMKSRVKADMDAFRQLMAEGDRRSARQLGEGLIQRIEAIRESYDQIGKQIGNTKKTGGHKSEMTKFSNELKRGLTDIAENATGTFADEIEGSLGGVGDAGESMGDAFLEEIRSAFGIQSPSKKMQEIGRFVVKGLRNGLYEGDRVISEFVRNVKAGVADVKEAAQDVAEQAKTIVDENSGPVVDGVQGVVDDLEGRGKKRVNEARRLPIEIGKQIAAGLGIGVRENLEAVKDDLVGNLGEAREEAEFQLKRGLTKFEDSGGIAGLDENAANAISMVRSEIEGLLDRLPLLKNLLAFGAKTWAQFALVSGAFGAVGKAFQVAGLGQFISALASLPDTAIQAGQEAESLAMAFESVTGSSELAAQSMEYVSDVARKFSIDVRAAEEAYLGLVATTRGTELEGFQTQQIFEAFAQTAALRGLSQQQQGQMFTAVQQVLGKGKLSAEEVRGQLGEIPALAFQQTLADSLGVNLQQLDKLLSSGQLQSDALFKVAQTYAAANAQLSQGMGTAAQSATRFENAVVALQRAFGSQFLGIQREGLAFFAGLLEGIADRAESLSALLRNGLILVLGNLITTIVGSATALMVIRMALVALINLIESLLPFLAKFAAGLVAVSLAIEVWGGVINSLKLSDAENQVLALSAAYQDLGVSIEEAAQKQGLMAQIRQGAGNFVNWTQERLGIRTTREYQAGNAAAFSQAQTSVANLAISDQNAGIKAAEKLLQIEQDMVDVRSYRISLTANDGAELERTKKQLEDLRKEADRYQESVSQARSNADAALQASKAVVEQLRSRYADSLTEEEKQELQEQIDAQLKNINLLEQGQQELDLATSRVSRNLSTIATLVSRVGQRVAAFQENLANAFNEYRTQLIETGLNLGIGEQVIRLQLDQADLSELQTRVSKLRQEAQDLEEKTRNPDLGQQVRNIEDRAKLEGTEIGTEFLQAIVSENLENVEAAQVLLQLQDLRNQISQGEFQIAQQALQTRQSVRDMTRSVFDFLRQLDQEFAELQLQLQEQLADLKNAFRRSQLQRLLVPGSTGLFGDVVQGIQGLLDQAAEVATRYLGQERRKLEISQRRYDLSTRLEDFRNSLGGATDALNGFTAALTGRTEAGAGVPGSSSFGSFPSPGGATTGGEVLLGFTGNTGSSTGPHLDIRKRDGYRQLTDAELNRFNVNGRSLTSYPVTSAYGNRINPVTGNQQFHQGIDFGIDVGSKITTTVPVRSVSLRDPSQTGGGGWVTDVVFEDGLEVSLLHLDPSTQGAGVGRRSVGTPSGISSTGASASVGSQQLSVGQLVGIAQAAGFSEEDARIMAAVAMAESSGNPRAHNPNASTGDNSYGLWQINMLGAMGPERRQAFGIQSNDQLFDPATNARAAREIYESQGFGAWSVYRSGAYRQYLSQAQSAPASPITNRDVVQAQSTADAIMQTSERMASVDSSQTTVAVINLLVGAKNAVEELRRSLRTGRRDMLNSSRGILTSLEQYLNPDTLTQAIQQNENTFIDFGNQVEVERERIQDTATQLHLLMDPATGLPAMIQQLRASGDEADEVVANSLEEQLNLVRDTSQIIDLNLRIFDIKATERRIEEARQRELQYVTEKNRLETENAQIAVDLENAQARNNIEGERGLAIAQERNNLQLRLLELNREFSDRPDILSERIESETRKTEIAIRTLEFQAQQKALSERQYQNDISNQLLEAQATQAEGPRGDNGLFGFRAQGLREEAALLQEQLRYEQQILELRQRYQDPVFAGLLTQLEEQAAVIRDINIQNIDNQFKDLGETIEEVGTSSLSSFFNELFTGTQTIGQALRGLVSSVLKSLAQIAAQNVSRSIVGRIAGAIGGAIGGGGQAAFTSPAGWSGWKYGGTIPAYAEGGRVVPDGISSTLREILPGMNSSFMREGSGAVLGVFTPGEEVLSLKTGEAQRYQALKRALGPNPLHSVMAGNFAFGGTVGINPDILTGNVGRSSPYLPVSSVTQLGSSRGGFGGQNVTVNYQVNTPDANSFRKSQFQINRDATLEAQRLLARR